MLDSVKEQNLRLRSTNTTNTVDDVPVGSITDDHDYIGAESYTVRVILKAYLSTVLYQTTIILLAVQHEEEPQPAKSECY